MLATTRAPAASRAGNSSMSHAATPGPWRPTAFNIPPGTAQNPRAPIARPPDRQTATSRRPRRSPDRSTIGAELGAVTCGTRSCHHRCREPDARDEGREIDLGRLPAMPHSAASRAGSPLRDAVSDHDLTREHRVADLAREPASAVRRIAAPAGQVAGVDHPFDTRVEHREVSRHRRTGAGLPGRRGSPGPSCGPGRAGDAGRLPGEQSE